MIKMSETLPFDTYIYFRMTPSQWECPLHYSSVYPFETCKYSRMMWSQWECTHDYSHLSQCGTVQRSSCENNHIYTCWYTSWIYEISWWLSWSNTFVTKVTTDLLSPFHSGCWGIARDISPRSLWHLNPMSCEKGKQLMWTGQWTNWTTM